jgi:DNA-binding beta-propeller fold protein YncE
MAGVAGRMAAVTGLTAAALMLAACAAGGSRVTSTSTAGTSGDDYGLQPQRVLHAPGSMLAATEFQANGVMWALTGPGSAGLFQISSATGQVKSSFPVSDFARSVAESRTGVIALALDTGRSGALQLINAGTRKVTRVVRLPWPAEQVAVARGSSTFYVLTARPGQARVTIVTGPDGRVAGTVAVPADVTSVVPGTRPGTLYAIERNGLLDVIGVPGSKLVARIRAGSGGGESVALSPDGRTLYVLEQLGGIANIALVNPATRLVEKVLPAPGTCIQVLVSPDGGHLYEVVRTAGTGSIQVTAA